MLRTVTNKLCELYIHVCIALVFRELDTEMAICDDRAEPKKRPKPSYTV